METRKVSASLVKVGDKIRWVDGEFKEVTLVELNLYHRIGRSRIWLGQKEHVVICSDSTVEVAYVNLTIGDILAKREAIVNAIERELEYKVHRLVTRRGPSAAQGWDYLIETAQGDSLWHVQFADANSSRIIDLYKIKDIEDTTEQDNRNDF